MKSADQPNDAPNEWTVNGLMANGLETGHIEIKIVLSS